MIKATLLKHLHRFVLDNKLNLICTEYGVSDENGYYIFILTDYATVCWPDYTYKDPIEFNLSDPNICRTLEQLCIHYHREYSHQHKHN